MDTHVLLWWLADDPTLSDIARRTISKADNTVFVSAATAWEVSIKQALGKLEAPDDLAAAIAHCGFDELPISVAHGLAAGTLPPLHTDPFDRVLIAQAVAEELTLITRGKRIAEYDVPTITA